MTLARIDNVLCDGIGFVELWDQMGDDHRIAAVARTSLANEAAEIDAVRDLGLINRLMRDKHTSPFESVVFQWRVRAPIFVNRQWFRHRWASYNEESGRYVELQDEFYVPDQIRHQIGKKMTYIFEEFHHTKSEALAFYMQNRMEAANDDYGYLLTHEVAKEQARMILPVAQYSTFIWTVNGLSLMNFLYLRNEVHAQAEIRAYAQAIEGVFAERLPITARAFREHWGIAMLEGVNTYD